MRVDRHRVLQILINLLRNAKYALDDVQRIDKRITVSIAPVGEKSVHVVVKDNGIGISQENLARIFSHGFTTRKNGHGFGLHSGALAAQEMGGSLRAESLASAGAPPLPSNFPSPPIHENTTGLPDHQQSHPGHRR